MSTAAVSLPAAESRLRGFRRRSLRFEVLLILLMLLSVSFVAVAAATAVALHGFLLQRLDQQLLAAGDRFSLSLEHPSDGDAGSNAQFGGVAGQAAGTLGARVLNGSVTAIDVVARRRGQAPPSAADKRLVAALTPTSRPRTIRFPDLGEYRVLVASGADGDLLITGLPEHSVDETTAHLLATEAVVFGAALLLAGAAAALSVRWSLKPLHRVAATAHEVSDLPLSTGAVSLPDRVSVVSPSTESGQVAEAFNHMLEHVEAALRDRHTSEDRLRHFVADASHELRTPVAVIRSHAEYAHLIGGDLPEPVTEALTRITAESDRMGHLVQDLLLLARLDSGRELELEQHEVDLTRLVLDAVTDARATARDHRWQLDLSEKEVNVEGDARALHQVLANLLSNARTHTPVGTLVTTSLSAPRADGQVVLRISDDGPGIAQAMLPRVFDRFVRADASRSHSKGSGLGLSIVAAIVQAHDGSISVESQPGATAFTITLPGYAEAKG